MCACSRWLAVSSRRPSSSEGVLGFSDPGELHLFGKLGITLGVWLAYLLIFALRLTQRLHGTRFAWSCVVLFLFALLALWAVEMDRTASPLPGRDGSCAPFRFFPMLPDRPVYDIIVMQPRDSPP